MVSKILFLYAVIVLGFVCGRVLRLEKEAFAKLLIYVLTPIVVFHGAYTSPLTLATLLTSSLFFIVPTVICFLALAVGRVLFPDSRRNLVAFSAGSGNYGYFGIPIMTGIFGESALQTVVLSLLGVLFYSSFIAFYVAARGNSSVRESIRIVARIPLIYALILGLVLQLLGVPRGVVYEEYVKQFIDAYRVLGMMLVGIGLSAFSPKLLDWKLTASMFAGRFLLWPLGTVLFIFLETHYLGVLSLEVHRHLFLLAFVPLAADTVAVATQFRLYPEKAAVIVTASTLVSMALIPLAQCFLPFVQ